MRTAIVMAVLCVACGSDGPEAPSCQQGVTSFYDSGCYLADSDGNAIPISAVVADCKDVLTHSPGDECDRALDDLLICFDSVGDSCDCSPEQDDMLAACI